MKKLLYILKLVENNMSQKTRKNLSEFAVNICSASFLMLFAKELLSDKNFAESDTVSKQIADNSHIYLICKIPSFRYDHTSIDFSNGILSGNVCYKIKGDEKTIPFKQEYELLDNGVKLELSEYPYREIYTKNKDNVVVRYLPASAFGLLNGVMSRNDDIINFEVLYVGQAFGDGTRNPFDRLKSHSTLQKILADTSYTYPDDEIYILAFEYAPHRIFTNMDGRSKFGGSAKEDSKRFLNIIENPLSEYQQVCLVEAGLIRYFTPQYNKIYRESFPSPKHKILEQTYELDFSGLVVEINTEELDIRLFSKNVVPKEHHMSKIDLISHEERYGFFHFTLNPDKEPYIPDDIIS